MTIIELLIIQGVVTNFITWPYLIYLHLKLKKTKIKNNMEKKFILSWLKENDYQISLSLMNSSDIKYIKCEFGKHDSYGNFIKDNDYYTFNQDSYVYDEIYEYIDEFIKNKRDEKINEILKPLE